MDTQMMDLLGIDAATLPIIWDVNFLYGPRTTTSEGTHVLCEINVGSVLSSRMMRRPPSRGSQ